MYIHGRTFLQMYVSKIVKGISMAHAHGKNERGKLRHFFDTMRKVSKDLAGLVDYFEEAYYICLSAELEINLIKIKDSDGNDNRQQIIENGAVLCEISRELPLNEIKDKINQVLTDPKYQFMRWLYNEIAKGTETNHRNVLVELMNGAVQAITKMQQTIDETITEYNRALSLLAANKINLKLKKTITPLLQTLLSALETIADELLCFNEFLSNNSRLSTNELQATYLFLKNKQLENAEKYAAAHPDKQAEGVLRYAKEEYEAFVNNNPQSSRHAPSTYNNKPR